MPTIVRMEIRHSALNALKLADPDEKVAATQALWRSHGSCNLDGSCSLSAAGITIPGRPARPRLLAPKQVPARSPFTQLGFAALMHAVCHIEFNAINLALDAVWRFPGMPAQFYIDWLRVANEESVHFVLLRDFLAEIGYAYGDFDAHDGLWLMCEKTASNVLARMALVPRTLEARGLDATPLIQEKLKKVRTPHAIKANQILDIILRDEIGHVAIGNHWFHWLCEQNQLDTSELDQTFHLQFDAPRLRPPFNLKARQQAGFTEREISQLEAAAQIT